MQIVATCNGPSAHPCTCGSKKLPKDEADPQNRQAGAGSGAGSGAASPRTSSPSIHIDPTLGIVITQYLDADGGLAAQYPTQQAIANYQVYGKSQTLAG